MQDTAAVLADFFVQDDLARLTADAGELLDCPLMVIDDAFRVAAHYAPPDFSDPLFDRAVQQGVITYEAGAIISRSPALSAGAPDYVEVADSTRRRRFAPLISAGVRLGYLISAWTSAVIWRVSQWRRSARWKQCWPSSCLWRPAARTSLSARRRRY